MINNFFEDLERVANEPDTTIYAESSLEGYSDFYKGNEYDQVWWIDKIGVFGEHLFSFDRKKIYNLFADYPQNLTKEELEIFNRENPYWVEFFGQ